jgi:hypothetical protein
VPSSPHASSIGSGEERGDEESVPPFFNTTFSTHRASPLFIGSEGLTPVRLEALARRLREILVGDVVRGIQIGVEATDTPAGQVGPLRSVKIRWLDAAVLLGGDAPEDTRRAREPQHEDKRGLWIEIRHENAAYFAILLPGQNRGDANEASLWQMRPDETSTRTGSTESHFLQLPLLLLRMPLPLKNVIADWLSVTFDCHVSKLALGTRTIVGVWEDWMRTMGVSSKGPDVMISLAFNAPIPEPGRPDDLSESDDNDGDNSKPGLRSLDITIQPQDLRRFLHAGQNLSSRLQPSGATWEADARERRRLAGGNSDDGWAWRSGKTSIDHPFTEALGLYLNHHLALNMFHPSVRITQVSCGGFVLGASRLKIMRFGEPSGELVEAAWMFITKLGERIGGEAQSNVFS